MLIYHLVVKVHTNEHAETYCFTDVFSTLALAVKRGCREIESHIETLFKKDGDYEEAERDDFIEENIRYAFKVYEFDPVRRETGIWREDEKNITFENSVEFATFIEWEYDYRGSVISRWEQRGVAYCVMPSDYNEGAGTLFAKGDLVTVKKPFFSQPEDNPSGIYVVAAVPGRRADKKDPLSWENIYCLHYLYHGDEYSAACHDHVHESQLELFQGEISADSFLRVLSAFFKDKSSFSKEATERLYSSKKIYVGELSQHYKFIEGLFPRQDKDLSIKNL